MIEKVLPHLIRLLDDPSPNVRGALTHRLRECHGRLDSVEPLLADLDSADRDLLCNLIVQGHREDFLEQWAARQQRRTGADSDYLEDSLSLLSAYLDRQPISPRHLREALEELADSIDSTITDSEALARRLFAEGRFRGNAGDFYAIGNCNLLFTLRTGLGNPIGLATIFILVARRLSIPAEGCNFPGHFLALGMDRTPPILIDCFNRGEVVDPEELPPAPFPTAIEPASAEEIVRRVVRNFENACWRVHDEDGVRVARSLAAALP